jgi:hypothetical protein
LVRIVGAIQTTRCLIGDGRSIPIHVKESRDGAMTIVEAPPGVTGGVDTHLDTHVAADSTDWADW